MSALLSISAAFVSLVLFDGYIDDLKEMYHDSFRNRSMLGDLLIEDPGIHSKQGLAEPWKFLISRQQQEQIEEFLKNNSELIEQRVRFVNFQGMITNGLQSSIMLGRGFDVEQGEKVRGKNWSWNATYGIPLHKSEFPNAILLGQGLARKMGCSWIKPKNFWTFSGGYEPVEREFNCPQTDMQLSVMTAEGQLNAADVVTVGLIDAGYRDIDDRYLVTSIETAQMLMNSDSVNMISIKLNNSSDRNKLIENFYRKFPRESSPLRIMHWVDHPVGETYVKTLELMAVFRNFVVIVILIISVLSVVNTLIKIIKERSREIGTLRSIGFKSRQVLRMFIYETLMLSALGTMIGGIISILLTVTLNSLQIRYKAGMLSEPVLFKINFSLTAYLNAFFVLLFVSLLACLYSTRQEIKKKIVDNFNHV